MNIAQMLMHGPKAARRVSAKIDHIKTLHTPEAVAKVQAVLTAKRHVRWREAFSKFPDMTATTAQLTNAMGLDPSSTWGALTGLSMENPPKVKHMGSAKKQGPGKPPTIWKWIGD